MKIGFNRTNLFDARYPRTILNMSGTIELHGTMTLGAGSRLEVGRSGRLVIKGQVANSAGVTICCHDRIEIGGGTVISWDTLIMDKDFHFVEDVVTGKTKPDHKPIVIGNRTWLCAGSKVLKGAVLPDGCILSAGSVLSKAYEEKNCLLTGNPAHVVRRGVTRRDKK